MKQELADLPTGRLDALETARGEWNLAALLRGAEPDAPGDAAADLVYTPVAPCRVFDTRVAGGPLAVGTPRNFVVAGTTGFPAQGGTSGGCGIPEGPATSVIINLTVVNMTGSGNLRAWAVATPQPPAPNAAILTYGVVTGLGALANGIAVPICNLSANPCSSDLRLQAFASSTHVVGDVVGYFRSFNSGATVLQPGQTVYGTIGAQYQVSSSVELAASASLPIRASVALQDDRVQVAGADALPGECPGTFDAPSAAPGYVCMYPFFSDNATVFFAHWAYTAP